MHRATAAGRGLSATAEDAFQRVLAAFETLADPRARARYDEQLAGVGVRAPVATTMCFPVTDSGFLEMPKELALTKDLNMPCLTEMKLQD